MRKRKQLNDTKNRPLHRLHRLGHRRTSTVHILLLAANFLWLAPTAEAEPASITNLTASRTANGITVQFSLASASNNVPYNFYRATSLTQNFWTYLGPVFASNNYAFSNQPLPARWYQLSGPPATMPVAW